MHLTAVPVHVPRTPYQKLILVMRLIAIFLFGAFMHASGAGFSQVSLREKEAPLAKVLDLLSAQSGLKVVYEDELMTKSKPVTITLENATTEEALKQIFSGQPVLTYEIIDGEVIAVKNKAAMLRLHLEMTPPEIDVRGKVLNEKGEPVEGVTVTVKGTNYVTATDINGHFFLRGLDGQSVLVITGANIETYELRVNNRGSINITVNQKVSDLDETVVVAYGKTTQRTNTGAVTVVKGDDIRSIPNMSFDKNLQGYVPGLLVTSGTGQPGGATSNFVLRGVATATPPINGSTVRNPLIVVDGVPLNQDAFQMNYNNTTPPVTNPLAQLNPADIETYSILKDAAAIALYGSRASNGVIVITTKKGRSGKTTFTFSSQVDVASRLKGKVKPLNQEQYLALLFETYRNTPRFVGGVETPWTDDDIMADLRSKFPTKADGSFYPDPDWSDILFDDHALTTMNNVSASGGNERSNFYLNLEYTRQDGIVKNTGYDRKSTRFNFENRPADWLKFGINTTLSYNRQEYGGSTRAVADASLNRVMSPLNPVYLEDGTYIFNYNYGIDNLVKPNPVAAAQYNINRNTAYRGLGKFYVEINLLKDIKITSSAGVDFMLAETKEKVDPRLYDASIFGTGGRIEEQDVRRFNLITTNIVRYDKAISSKHVFGLLAGQEAQMFNDRNMLVAVKGLSSPYYEEITSPGVTILRQNGFTRKENLQSFFGQGNYSFSNKYFFSASIRKDGSSRFGDEKRYGTYWSTGIGWVLSSEQFMKGVSWLNFLKLRGSIGAAGNAGAIDANTRYDLLENHIFLGNTAVSPTNTPGNPNAQWEQTFTWDAGLEMKLVNERVNLSADIYERKTSDLLYAMRLPANTGYQNVLGNIGDMKNSGMEFNLSVNVTGTRAFGWNINANWATNKNVLVKAFTPAATLSSGPVYNQEGMAFNSFYLRAWAGVDPETGSGQYIDSTGKVTNDYNAAKPSFVGKIQPDGFGAITNTFHYKGVELSAMLYYQYGYQIYNRDQMVNDGYQPYQNQDERALNRWQKPGDIAINPKRTLNNSSGGALRYSTRYLYDGDHIRLQRVVLSYLLPKHFIERLHLRSFKVFAQGNNLAVWSRFPGEDISNVSTNGVADNFYPNQRSFSFGLNVMF